MANDKKKSESVKSSEENNSKIIFNGSFWVNEDEEKKRSEKHHNEKTFNGSEWVDKE